VGGGGKKKEKKKEKRKKREGGDIQRNIGRRKMGKEGILRVGEIIKNK
jgi:hypothetical protein